MILATSFCVKELQSNSTSGWEGVGIHPGWAKLRGSEWYTSVKKEAAASSPNVGTSWPSLPSRTSLAHRLKSLWHLSLDLYLCLSKLGGILGNLDECSKELDGIVANKGNVFYQRWVISPPRLQVSDILASLPSYLSTAAISPHSLRAVGSLKAHQQ